MPSNCTGSFLQWHDKEDTKEEVNRLRLAVKKNSRNLPMFTDGSKRSAIDTGDYQPSHRTGNAAIDAVERLEGSVYDVVPDDHETDGSTWELYEKVQDRNYISTHDVALTVVLQPPPHVRIVYRQKDPNKAEYMAKHVREGSNELAIHKYVQSRSSRSPRIISLIESKSDRTTPSYSPIRAGWWSYGRVILRHIYNGRARRGHAREWRPPPLEICQSADGERLPKETFAA